MKKYQSFAPRTLFSVRSLAVGLLGSALGCTQAQDISFYLVGKGQNYVQAGTNAPALRVQSPHAFVALTAPTPAGAVLSASLRTPSNAVHQLTLGEYGQLSREQSFTVTNELNVQFPQGTYWLTNETASFGRQTARLNLGAEKFPGTPRIANWTAAQAVDPDSAFVLSWLPFSGASAVDRFIRVELEDSSGETAFATGWPRETNALASTNTSVTIPDGTLAPGETYQGRLLFFNAAGVNTTNIPGARGLAGFFRSTEFKLTTVNPAGTVRLSAERYITNEFAGFAEVTIERVGGSSGAITVNYFADVDGSVTLEDGETQATVLVEIVDDDEAEDYEQFLFFIDSVEGDANLGTPTVAVLTVIDDDSTPGPNVLGYDVAKGQTLVQTNAGAPVATEQGRYCFLSTVDEAFPGGATSATVRRPGSPARTFTLTREDFHDRLSLKQSFYTREWLDKTFTNGNYTFSIRTPLDGTKAPVLNLPAANFPSVPRVLNWDVTEALDTDAEVPLRFTPFTNPGPNDYIRLRIESGDGFVTLDSEDTPETRISATNTSISLPTSELYQDEAFEAHLTFVRVVSTNTTGYPGVPGRAEYFSDTKFTLQALPPPSTSGRFRFTEPEFSALESDGMVLYGIERLGGADDTIQVQVVASSGGGTNGAISGTDFPAYSEVLSFAPGETFAMFPILLTDDAVNEPNEKFKIRLEVLSPASDVGYPSVADVTIIEPDRLAPTLTVTAPAPGARTLTNTFTARGTSRDNVGVTLVEWCVLNRVGITPFVPATTANEWTNWTARTTELYAGLNTFRIRARDARTNYTTVEAAVFYESKQRLKLLTSGLGTVPGWSNNASLVVGSNYTIKAQAGPGFVFSNWVGGIGLASAVLTQNATLRFIMETSLCLQANFVPSPFLVATGGYYGLFYPESDPHHTNSGFFQFNLSGNGTYTAKLLSGGFTNMPLAGKLAWDGQATNVIGSNGLTRVEWALKLGGAFDQTITGRVVTATGESILLGDRAPNFGPTGRSPYAGRYTATIVGNLEDPTAPGGDAALTAFVETNGWVTLAGNIADGSAVNQSVPVSTNGAWPLYALVNGRRGSVLGWAQFYTNASPATNVESTRVKWSKLPVNPPAAYSNGFAVERTLHGFRYAPANPAVRITNGVVTFAGPSLDNGFANSVTLTRTNTIVNHSANALTLTITPSNGTFKGTVTLPNTTNKVSFNGVLLQRSTNGVGYFMRNGLGGKVTFEAAPPPAPAEDRAGGFGREENGPGFDRRDRNALPPTPALSPTPWQVNPDRVPGRVGAQPIPPAP